jgi:hypothetical protein
MPTYKYKLRDELLFYLGRMMKEEAVKSCWTELHIIINYRISLIYIIKRETKELKDD